MDDTMCYYDIEDSSEYKEPHKPRSDLTDGYSYPDDDDIEIQEIVKIQNTLIIGNVVYHVLKYKDVCFVIDPSDNKSILIPELSNDEKGEKSFVLRRPNHVELRTLHSVES